ncbi:MAG: DHH family phosphoesterase [Senegalia sp. (in: firmicutes)]|uniref:DHH family phosphoesterase n=1 Tax=Senegalia sp. (in: firmicutes) TaxID=1924098 RepID=UPI003F9786E0
MKINILKELDRFDQIYLISHVNPDGDSIGSLLALGKALKNIYNDKVILLKSDNIPNKFMFLKDIDLLSNLDVLDNIKDNSILITLDCGDISRIGSTLNYIEKFNKIINIDHHISNDKFGDINILDSKTSSTGEIVFNLLKDNKLKIDKNIATSLYMAISTDTGSFKYESATSKTYKAAAELLEYDIDKSKIIFELYQNRSIEKTNIFIEAIKNIEFHNDNKIGNTTVTLEMMRKVNASPEDVNGIVEFIRDTENVEVAYVIKEVENNKFKISFRSKAYLDVSAIANVFGGGGHIRASGITIDGDLSNIKENLLIEIRKRLRC